MSNRDYRQIAPQVVSAIEEARKLAEETKDLQRYITFSKDINALEADPERHLSWLDDLGDGELEVSEIVEYFTNPEKSDRRDDRTAKALYGALQAVELGEDEQAFAIGFFRLYDSFGAHSVAVLSREKDGYFYDTGEAACTIVQAEKMLNGAVPEDIRTFKVKAPEVSAFLEKHAPELKGGALHVEDYTGKPEDYLAAVAFGTLTDGYGRIKIPQALLEGE